ncbi:hypothetical protein J2T57_003377 [Natronocella acetinitrilica]|uniref:Cobyrinic acid a,c-diamide synthase n=1 Tax=Natronocella acetinitrilica TaxID=414046 RepID=A0AAE3KDF6_9GAMM|nr:cobyrinic acid a,c-diamide synthase [Natronocella acetinitrilica]MCP1676218.1 hypothetical protein [Natronocella acetinitrilica]
MFAFLQGLAYGLFLSCPIWFMVGMMNPAKAVPTDPPRRWHVIARYWFAFPALAFLLWLTSLWGGFGPSLWGWLAGLAVIPASLPLERYWLKWRRQRAQLHKARSTQTRAAAGESALLRLDGARPPEHADAVVQSLWQTRRRLLAAGRKDLITQVDRVYTRKARLTDLLGRRFNPGELTYERGRSLVGEVCNAAVDHLNGLAARAEGLAGMDVAYVRRRLAAADIDEHPEERKALQARLDLIAGEEAALRADVAGLESMLTALDDATLAISRLDTDRPTASVEAGRALDDLRRFAERSAQYSHDRTAP